jgi:hypothetical protein
MKNTHIFIYQKERSFPIVVFMGGELDRINPTIVEGAEDIFGAELQTERPGSWGKRKKSNSRMTHDQVSQLRKHLKRRKDMKRAEQGYNDKMDESLGMRHRGMHSQTMSDRRNEASAMDKRHSKTARKYDDVRTMDAQGYNDKLDESLGMRHRGSHSQTRKDRRNESKGMEKSMGRRPYSGVRTMDAETFKAPVSEENMVNEGSVDAVYGGGVNVAVSSDGITPTSNPSVDEAFDVGNDVGVDVADQEVMNVNPSVDAQYGNGTMNAESNDIVNTVQNLTDKVGFRMNGWIASAIVVGIASMAGYHYAKR